MLIAIIPRALPWARSFCPFRACCLRLACVLLLELLGFQGVLLLELLPFQGVLLLELLGLQGVLLLELLDFQGVLLLELLGLQGVLLAFSLRSASSLSFGRGDRAAESGDVDYEYLHIIKGLYATCSSWHIDPCRFTVRCNVYQTC